MAGGEGWAAPAEGKSVDVERGKEMKARKMQTIQFGSHGFVFSFSYKQLASEGGCCTQRGSSARPPNALGGCMCPFPTLKSCLLCRGRERLELGEVRHAQAHPGTQKDAFQDPQPGEHHITSSQHHLLPPAFLGRFSHRGPVRLSISPFGARMNIY